MNCTNFFLNSSNKYLLFGLTSISLYEITKYLSIFFKRNFLKLYFRKNENLNFKNMEQKSDISLLKSNEGSIKKTTVKTGKKYGKIKLPTIKVYMIFEGWLSNPDLNVFDNKMLDMHGLNPFILSLHISFAYDLPITITPDILWIVITQGFTQHINKNPEKYRKSFVDFNGKKEITIVRNEFFSDITTNDWSTIFPEFTEKN